MHVPTYCKYGTLCSIKCSPFLTPRILFPTSNIGFAQTDHEPENNLRYWMLLRKNKHAFELRVLDMGLNYVHLQSCQCILHHSTLHLSLQIRFAFTAKVTFQHTFIERAVKKLVFSDSDSQSKRPVQQVKYVDFNVLVDIFDFGPPPQLAGRSGCQCVHKRASPSCLRGKNNGGYRSAPCMIVLRFETSTSHD
jgi:hypothetical protein